MTDQVTRLVLDNGLTVLLKEIHTAPLISQWVWYRVGSRNEIPGTTGISHWVEHMQFKGTPQFPAGVLDKAISRDGGYWNAMTYIDWTTYFLTMPADKIDLAIQLEADRMANSLFPEEEVESERTVIISEREGNENHPLFKLNEEIGAAAFRVHPYHHEVIGDMADLHTISRDQLYNHYKTYYTPANAILTVAGDFDTEDMLKRIKKAYGAVPAGKTPPAVTRPEPEQKGERRVTVEGPGETAFVKYAYKAPNGTHPDFYALTVMDSLLTGPSNLNMFGGGISNKTSRLYQSMVETELAVSVNGGLQATIDPYIYTITLTVHPQHTAEEVTAAFEEQIRLVQEQPPSQDELDRAVKQAKALFAYGSESITNQAFWLGFAEIFDTYEWFDLYIERLSQVTADDVLRVAREYLQPSRRVLGIYTPENNGAAS